MTETFSGAEAVQLAVVERSGFIESRHIGSAVVLGADGSVVRSLGNPVAPILPRSSMKLFQAIAVMNAGVDLTGTSAAIATSSHAGTAAHVELVRTLLSWANLDERALQCPAAWPGDSATRRDLIRDGDSRRPLYMECSGKHAAMLLACTRNGWPTESYLEPQHPLQVSIREVIERLTGEKIVASAVDGCGAPAHALSLQTLARGIQRIATASEGSPFALYRNAASLTQAVLANGWVIEGRGLPNTLVVDRLGVLAKGGAEGVMVMACPSGATVALKVLDGSSRAATAVALQLLVDAGEVEADACADVLAELHLNVSGGGRPVGRIRAQFSDSTAAE